MLEKVAFFLARQKKFRSGAVMKNVKTWKRSFATYNTKEHQHHGEKGGIHKNGVALVAWRLMLDRPPFAFSLKPLFATQTIALIRMLEESSCNHVAHVAKQRHFVTSLRAHVEFLRKDSSSRFDKQGLYLDHAHRVYYWLARLSSSLK